MVANSKDFYRGKRGETMFFLYIKKRPSPSFLHGVRAFGTDQNKNLGGTVSTPEADLYSLVSYESEIASLVRHGVAFDMLRTLFYFFQNSTFIISFIKLLKYHNKRYLGILIMGKD